MKSDKEIIIDMKEWVYAMYAQNHISWYAFDKFKMLFGKYKQQVKT